MSTSDTNTRALDAAYRPFPSFNDWSSQTLVDPIRWDRYKADLLAQTKDLAPDILERARKIATRAAALDTGAIEGLYDVDRGFTFSVAQEVATWETLLAAKGENVRPLFEAQLQAYDFVLSLATKAEPISEAAIRALHAEICKAQATYRAVTAVGIQEQPLPKGQYKALPNHVRTRKGTDHSYAPVDVTPAEMARFVRELRSEAFQAAHPVLQASYAHYALVVIHPFADGNGRVARALASTFTYRALSIPILILSEHKARYLDALELADGSSYQAFVEFILARALDTIDLVDESLRSAKLPSVDQSFTAVSKLYITKGGYTQDDVDQAGIKLLQNVAVMLNSKFTEQPHPKLETIALVVSVGFTPPNGYRRPIGEKSGLQVRFTSSSPAYAQVTRLYGLLLPQDAAGDDDILIRQQSKSEAFRARMDELLPVPSSILQVRIEMFAERIISEMVAELIQAANKQVGR